MKQLGFGRVQADKKRFYIDGHEGPDVFRERDAFVELLMGLEDELGLWELIVESDSGSWSLV